MLGEVMASPVHIRSIAYDREASGLPEAAKVERVMGGWRVLAGSSGEHSVESEREWRKSPSSRSAT